MRSEKPRRKHKPVRGPRRAAWPPRQQDRGAKARLPAGGLDVAPAPGLGPVHPEEYEEDELADV